jgi:hypothetical protein
MYIYLWISAYICICIYTNMRRNFTCFHIHMYVYIFIYEYLHIRPWRSIDHRSVRHVDHHFKSIRVVPWDQVRRILRPEKALWVVIPYHTLDLDDPLTIEVSDTLTIISNQLMMGYGLGDKGWWVRVRDNRGFRYFDHNFKSMRVVPLR